MKKRGYSSKVDTWALGVMLYEMLMGVTPFHSYEMKDLIAKINDGRYKLTLKEPITIECSLFLVQCLQSNEADRIPMEELQDHPFISASMHGSPLTRMKLDQFDDEMKKSEQFEAPYNTIIKGQDSVTNDDHSVVYSTKNGDQLKILVN